MEYQRKVERHQALDWFEGKIRVVVSSLESEDIDHQEYLTRMAMLGAALGDRLVKIDATYDAMIERSLKAR